MDKIRCAFDLEPYYLDKSSKSWMIEIYDDYLQSQVSYYGLQEYVHYYKHATYAIKGRNFDISDLETSKKRKLIDGCKTLYGLLHCRFINTDDGVYEMNAKYERGLFGRCPRINCEGEKLLPIGLTNVPGIDTVKTFCPRCHDVYETSEKYDAAFFGPDFPIMFCKQNHISLSRNYIPFRLTEESEDEASAISPNINHRLVRWGEK